MNIVLGVAILISIAVILYITPVEVRGIKAIQNLPATTKEQTGLRRTCVGLRVFSVSLFVAALVLGPAFPELFTPLVVILLVSQGLKLYAFSVERKLRDDISISKNGRRTTSIEQQHAQP